MGSPNENITVEVGDLTQCAVDAIVNAANSALLPGGGVCGAIHAVGGPIIAEECAEIIAMEYPAGLLPGQAVATTAGRLPAKFVIHAVGPIFDQHPDPDRALAQTYASCLQVAAEIGATSIAFPAISTGIYGFPPERAAGIVWRTLVGELAGMADAPQVHLVFFDDRARDIFETNCG